MPTSKGMLTQTTWRIGKLLFLLIPVLAHAQSSSINELLKRIPPQPKPPIPVQALPSSEPASNYALKSGSFVPANKKNVETVDLSNLFLDQIDQQQSGSCHIYSATALIEAFCKKVTGFKIDISESYFFYRHMRNALEDSGMATLSSKDLMKQLDGGAPYITLERFRTGSACTKGEFSMTEKNLIQIANLIEGYSKTATKKLKPKYEQANRNAIQSCPSPEALKRKLDEIRVSFNSQFRAEVCEKVDSQVRCHVPKQNVNSSPSEARIIEKTTNPNLQKCIDRLDRPQIVIRPSQESIMSILKAGNPVLCGGQFIFAPGSQFDKNKMMEAGGHGTIIYGYKKDPKTNKVEFLIRDSNFTQLHPYTVTGCDVVFVLKEKKVAPRIPAGKK